jgi:hypothetical protein
MLVNILFWPLKNPTNYSGQILFAVSFNNHLYNYQFQIHDFLDNV